MAFDEAVFAEHRLDPNGWTGLRDATFRTGGGTDFTDLFTRAARYHPAIAVILTDLDATLPPAPGFPVLWAVPQATPQPAYGRVLHIGDLAP